MEQKMDVIKAAFAGISEPQLKELLQRILKGKVPGHVKDEALDRDLEVPKTETISAEQALCQSKGATYARAVLERIAAANERIEALRKQVGTAKEKVRGPELTRLDFMRQRLPGAYACFLLSAVILIFMAVALVGEIHLLLEPLRDWIGDEHGKNATIYAAAAVVVAALTLLADAVFQPKTQPLSRWLCTVALLVFAGLLGAVRATTLASDQGVSISGCLFWTMMSIAAPVVVGYLTPVLWSQLIECFSFAAERWFHGKRVGLEQEELFEIEGRIGSSEQSIDSGIDEFNAAYQEHSTKGERQVEEGRTQRRSLDAMLARLQILYHCWLKLIPKIAVAVAAVLAILAVILFLAVGRAHAEDNGKVPVYMVVLCDRSDSSVDLACSSARIAAAFDAWAPKAMSSRAGQFDVLVIGSGVHDVALVFSESAPKGFRPPLSQSKRSWLKAARQRVLEAPLPAKKNASAILEGIYAASFRLSGLRGDRQLVIMSDLRQVFGHWNFERRVPENLAEWLGALPGKPEIQGMQVSVCGFHTASVGGSTTTVPQLIQLRLLWSETFKYWGFPDVPILEECDFSQEAGNRMAGSP